MDKSLKSGSFLYLPQCSFKKKVQFGKVELTALKAKIFLNFFRNDNFLQLLVRTKVIGLFLSIFKAYFDLSKYRLLDPVCS